MRLRLVVGLVFAAGCVGTIGDGGDGNHGFLGKGGPGSDTTSETAGGIDCDASTPPELTPMRRLTRRQYDATVRDLLVATLGNDDGDAAFASLGSALTNIPVDARDGFRRFDQKVFYQHVYGYYTAARAIGSAIAGYVDTITADCAGDDRACVRRFVDRFGRRAFRRPLSDDELSFYVIDALGTDDDLAAEAFAERIAVILSAPDFVYVLEDDKRALDGYIDLFPLSGYELAARLALHFWNTAPDDALVDAAAEGRLDSDDGYAAVVEQVLLDPRTQSTIDGFLLEWLHLEDGTSSDARDDATGALRHYAWTTDGTYDDLLLSRLSFAKTDELAEVYGVDPLTAGEAPQGFADDVRVGLIARAALLEAGKEQSHPIQKGMRIRRHLLCDTLPDPPPDVDASGYEPDGLRTTRQRAEELTQQTGSSCAVCHNAMNPLGFVTEMFDGYGRHREKERIYDEANELVDELAIDTSAVVAVTPADERVVSTPGELTEIIIETGKSHACAAERYFRFTYGREEDGDVDACSIETLRASLVGGSIRDMLRAVAMQPQFRLRRR